MASSPQSTSPMAPGAALRQTQGVQRPGERGQALIETALVMPLFVFILLGTMQLGLMHQARLLTKYAAYKAVRAGAIGNVKMDTMEQAALAVLVPMISRQRAITNGTLEQVYRVGDGAAFGHIMSDAAMTANLMPEAPLKFAEVTVCGPTLQMLRKGSVKVKGGEEYDFDDGANASSTDWEKFERTKLFVQVTFNYRMMIPFANLMLYEIARGQEKAELMWVARMSTDKPTEHHLGAHDQRDAYDELAHGQHIYVLPIRANYGMRMQSNLFPTANGYELPGENQCLVPFAKKGEGGTAAVGVGGDDTEEGGDPGEPP